MQILQNMKDNAGKDVEDRKIYIKIETLNNGLLFQDKTNKRKTFTYFIDVNWEQCRYMSLYFIVLYLAGKYQQSSHILKRFEMYI